MQPLVTILVVTYNHAAYIGECLQGILAQSYGNLQILVLDDASTDGTEAIAAAYSDPKITYIRRERNVGLVENHNEGLALAGGDLIWLMSGDDCFIDPEAIASVVRDFERHPDVGFIFSRPASNSEEHLACFDCGPEKRLMTGGEVAKTLAVANVICGPATVARASVFKTFAKYPHGFSYVGDWYFWFRFALESKHVLYRPERSIFYRYHEANLTSRFFSEKQADRLVQQIQLRLAMLELTHGMEGFKEPIMTALRKAVHGLLDFWMNRPSSRNEIWQQLGRRWELDEVPRAEVNLASILSAVLAEEGRAMVSKALRQRRPLYFLRALQLQAALPGLRRAAVATPE